MSDDNISESNSKDMSDTFEVNSNFSDFKEVKKDDEW